MFDIRYSLVTCYMPIKLISNNSNLLLKYTMFCISQELVTSYVRPALYRGVKPAYNTTLWNE